MSRIALPIASRDAPGFSGSYHAMACSHAALTNGTMCGCAPVSMSSCEMISSRLHTIE